MVCLGTTMQDTRSKTLVIVRALFYFTLFGVGIYFIYQGDVVQRYLLRRTDFTVYEEDITELPTVVTYLRISLQH